MDNIYEKHIDFLERAAKKEHERRMQEVVQTDWYKDGGYTWKDMINTGEKEDLLDAAFEMIVWLKENKKL